MGATTSADRAAVESMAAAQFHRGPDDSGLFRDPRVVLGHRRLSIIDLSPAGHQPMSNYDATVWVAYNGEIYNYRDLAGQLSHRGFRSRSDTEVLLHGYEEWGLEGLLERLRGMFAFALYDARPPEPRCVLARDRFGIKPLYYIAREDFVAFASEVKALVKSGCASSEPNAAALTGLLLLGSVPAPATVMRDVECLMPGHYLSADGSGVRVRRYWDPETSRRPRPLELAEALSDSVERHLVSDVPLGVFLSGGVDSAAIAALAKRAQASLATLTVVFEEQDFNEAAEARQVASHFATTHREIRVTNLDFIDQVPRVLDAMDQPTNDGVNTWFVARAARQAGLTVVLSGLGGDEIFGGYKHHQWLARHASAIGRFAALPGPVRRAAVRTALEYGRFRGRENWLRLASLSDGVSDEGLYLAVRGFFPPRQVSALLDVEEGEVHRVALESLTFPQPASVNGAGRDRAFRRLEMKRYLHDQLLRDTDVFSMAHSIEVRVPYLDHLVAECAPQQPVTLATNGAGNKPLLTAAVADPVVSEAARRPKRGFVFPFGQWMRQHSDELREMAMAGGYLNRRTIAQLWQEFENGRLHWSRAWMLSVIGAGK
jgi:asparagine synthase (glutamine-hydrolysing)